MRILKPMLCQIGTQEDLKNPDYIFEPKLDGIRALCYVDKTITLLSRGGHDITNEYPEFDFRKNIKATTAILDGEIIVYDKKGNPSFDLLQQRDPAEQIQVQSKNVLATFVIFDILMKNGKSLLKVPLAERKKILAATIKDMPNRLETIVAISDGKSLWKNIRKRHMEGVIAKRTGGHYYPGQRPSEWFKIKPLKTLDAIIIGYTTEKRKISALALAAYKHGKLHYLGKVGTGFSVKNIALLYKKLEKIKQSEPAVTNIPILKNIQWVKPIVVCEVKYMAITTEGRLRISTFLHVRSDKSPQECTI